MCVAIIVPEGVARPSLEQHRAYHTANSDGCGVAWLHTHKGRARVRWAKGMYEPEAMFDFIAQLPPGPLLLHYRIASSGGVSAGLCHPFPLARIPSLDTEGMANSVLIHNGTYSQLDREPLDLGLDGKPLPTSDTRVMAAIAYGSIVGLKALHNSYGKMAILHADGRIDKAGTWHDVDGVLHSNTFWQPSKAYTPYVYRPGDVGYRSTYETKKERKARLKANGFQAHDTPATGVPAWTSRALPVDPTALAALSAEQRALLDKYVALKEMVTADWQQLTKWFSWDGGGNLITKDTLKVVSPVSDRFRKAEKTNKAEKATNAGKAESLLPSELQDLRQDPDIIAMAHELNVTVDEMLDHDMPSETRELLFSDEEYEDMRGITDRLWHREHGDAK